MTESTKQETVDDLAARISADQRQRDADRAAMADEIVAGQRITTVEEGQRFAKAWIVTAAQHAANEEYYRGERDKLLRKSSMGHRIDRLLRQYAPGDRVRAVETIIYGTGEEVAEGTVGFIQQTNVHGCTPLVTVNWVGRGGDGQPPSILHPCSVESLEPAPLDPG
jgi:hypothetical protein